VGAGAWVVWWDTSHMPPTWLNVCSLVADGVTSLLPAVLYAIMLLLVKTKVGLGMTSFVGKVFCMGLRSGTNAAYNGHLSDWQCGGGTGTRP
jgi:hypothetical protein